MAEKYKIAVLASTRGTDLAAIIEAIQKGELSGVEISCVIANVKDCGALEKAKNAHITAYYLNSKGLDRKTYDQKIAEILDKQEIKLIVLIGYMRILSKWFVRKYARKIINIHPSLLPDFPGMDLDVHSEVIKAKRKESGMTIHFVDEGVDSGEIILQKKVKIVENETPESLKGKVQGLEKIWYPKVIQMFKEGKIK